MVSFSDIEARRARSGLTRKAVYERAGVNKETWRRLRRGSNAPNVRTLEKLSAALDQLIEEGCHAGR